MESNQAALAATVLAGSEVPTTAEDIGEPPAKKLCVKLSYVGEDRNESDESSASCLRRLDERLSTVLCCTVCLDLPSSTVYQVGKII